MDTGDQKLCRESQDSGSPASVETSSGIISFDKIKLPPSTPSALSPVMSPKITPTSKGVENAKKRLRAFSIQKKTPMTSIAVPKPVSTGNTTVLIGKLNSVKVTPKHDDQATEQKKPPRPPKPGTNKKHIQDYMDQQKKTLSEIEDMKRKMELVELGIPLGLICPSPHNYKAMPTKAMPPIKSFLDSAKVDEIILEAKKARAEGRKFKFDYQKLLPDYDNPFQRKKEESVITDKNNKLGDWNHRSKSKDRRKSDKYDRSHSYRRVDKGKYRDDREKQREERKYREKEDKNGKQAQKDDTQRDLKETDVNLNDYLVCDSWSLDNEDKSNSSPKVDDSIRIRDIPVPKDRIVGTSQEFKEIQNVSKIGKLKPVIDSFEYEIDPNEDVILDIFDHSSGLDKYTKVTTKESEVADSPVPLKVFDDNTMSKDGSDVNDDKFLQSVINEIKEDDMCDDVSHDKGLVEYEVSPPRDNDSQSDIRGSVTPELKSLNSSQMSDYSESYRSVESGYKSTESGYKSNASADRQYTMSTEREFQEKLSRSTMNSLETWSFVLKICQPLLFRHDKNNCYKETQTTPKLWYTENPRVCNCVKDRSIVYEELEIYKMNLVDRVYGCDQISDALFPGFRSWYPRSTQFLSEHYAVQLSADDDWEADDSQVEPNRNDRGSMTPQKNEEIYLDREYQKFMQALTDVSEHKADNSRSTTPVAVDNKAGEVEEKRKAKRFSSEGWSQESDIEEEAEKSKKFKLDKEKQRKRKHSTSSVTSSSEDQSKKKKKSTKNKESRKSKASKRKRLSKKYLKKLKEKQNKKKRRLMKLVQDSDEEDDDDDDDDEKELRRKDKKSKKKKQQKLKHSKQKKKKSKAKSSSSSESSTTSSESSSSETDSEVEKRTKKKKKDVEGKKKKHKKSTSEFQSDDLFDVNILNNIKTERITDDEIQITPRKKPREIINVKELQNDFVGNNIHIKKEVEDKIIVDSTKSPEESVNELQQNENELDTIEADNVEENVEKVNKDVDIQTNVELQDIVEQKNVEEVVDLQTTSEMNKVEIIDDNNKNDEQLKEQTADVSETTPQIRPADESSLCSSQESTTKEAYEKDESHLRPSSQNSNYNFNDVIASHSSYQKEDSVDKFQEVYEQGNYEMYEQLALAYQSDLDTQMKDDDGERRIETVVRVRARGEIKCDWRAGDRPLLTHHRPSRWGLKPGEVNIVLTGGGTATEQFPVRSVVEPQPVYQIQSLANRSDNCNISYDEAYMDTYGALDRLQYGDCFSENVAAESIRVQGSTTSSLDERISQALQNSVLSELTKEPDDTETDKDGPEKGILITKPVVTYESVRANKRVSFADGYKPGQDSDVEEPPVKKRKKVRRVGCAWPCPASHPDHVPLWDALPPPPPPPGSPPSAHRHQPQPVNTKFDPSVSLLNFMPPEPPPGILTF